ncbi:MAG: hypothetical protein BWX84_00219 [Verrucomicrobia bacterium ADurb.Bin118]|nr:MAG: hypothetical protein BWX84_00219 [Verrucomicrobia bacterium ADurb.Bin118]
MQPFILGLDVPSLVAAQQILERPEINERLAGGNLRRIAPGMARQVLPAVEIHMGFEIRLPRIFHGGLEGDHEHALRAEFLRQLVGGEGLAEAHLGVPEEARHGVHVFLPDGMEIGVRLVHSGALLGAQGKILIAGARDWLSRAERNQHRFYVLDRAAHPFQFRLIEPPANQSGPHFVIGEECPVVARGGLVQHDGVVLDVGGLELLGHAPLHVARGLPDLEQARVRLIRNRVGVDARARLRLRREDFFNGLAHGRTISVVVSAPTARPVTAQGNALGTMPPNNSKP